jgi:DNA-binding NarL/FixJ family response regulator
MVTVSLQYVASTARARLKFQQVGAEGGIKMDTKPKILIVDDEPEFVESLSAALKVNSYQVLATDNKTRAQEIARSEKPDTVVVGTMVPRGDACLFCRWLKQTSRLSNVPIIVIDAPPEKQATKGWRKAEGRAMEAEDYLMKPVNPEALATIVENLVEKESEKIRVMVVDDHAMVRDGIRALVGVQKDMQVIAEAVDGKDAVDKVKKYAPDIVLMDIVMPVMNGLKATEVICKECQKTKVLMLSQYDDEENIRESRKVGACGFIPKNTAATQLLSAIRSAS